MIYDVVMDSLVLEDFAEAFQYYNNISETVGMNFKSSFFYALYKIVHQPKNYFQVSKKLRRITLKKHPYMLIYQIEGNRVKVMALFHQSARPFKWKRL